MKHAILISMLIFAGCGSARDFLQPQSPRLANALDDDVIYSLCIVSDTLGVRDTIRGEYGVWNLSGEDRVFTAAFWDPLVCELRDGECVIRVPVRCEHTMAEVPYTVANNAHKKFLFTVAFLDRHGYAISPGHYDLRTYLGQRPKDAPTLILNVTVR
jgi:hypothetical protein